MLKIIKLEILEDIGVFRKNVKKVTDFENIENHVFHKNREKWQKWRFWDPPHF